MRICLLWIVLLASVSAEAIQVQYENGMQVQLGQTWNPNVPFGFGAAKKCFEVEIDEETPTHREELSQGVILSRSQAIDILRTENNASADFKFGVSKVSGEGKYRQLKEALSSERSIVARISVKRTYRAKQVQSAELKTEGRTLIAAKDKNAFYRDCGRSLITSIVKETIVSVVYIFKVSNKSKVSEVSKYVSAKFENASTEGGVSMSQEELSKAIGTEVTMDINVFQSSGSESTTTVSDLIALSNSDLGAVMSKANAVIGDIKWENSGIKSFEASPISEYFDVDPVDTWDGIESIYDSLDVFNRYAEELAERYFQLQGLKDDQRRGDFAFKPEAEDKIKSEQDEIEKKLFKLSQSAKKCLNKAEADKLCWPEKEPIDSGVLKYVDMEFGKFERWSASAGPGVYTSAFKIHINVTYIPEFSIRNLEYIKYLSVYKNKGLFGRYSQDDIKKKLGSNGILSLPNGDVRSSVHDCGPAHPSPDECHRESKDVPRIKNHDYIMPKMARDNYYYVFEDVEGGITQNYDFPNPTKFIGSGKYQ